MIITLEHRFVFICFVVAIDVAIGAKLVATINYQS